MENGTLRQNATYITLIIIEGSRRFKRTGKRNDIFLATKFAITGDPQRRVNGDPDNVKSSFEKSIQRLGGMLKLSSVF